MTEVLSQHPDIKIVETFDVKEDTVKAAELIATGTNRYPNLGAWISVGGTVAFATAGEIPVLAGPDFTIYSGGNFLAKTLEGVWAGQKKIDQAMAELQEQWQKGLDAG